ncbi:type VI secretion system-associated FHA domain protein TagH [Rheinheimera sp.]|uniref:type VI secretion system-associated FHA domain protein TagH n=1 Tax=Rheinheimera sp. TaxID=1869214 RepID=UPI002736EAF0|nr:type VI secretion system-associated FHA domain protein TagH [Rheinheimera sp.]MDP2713484.1 type VI secretion system-associated FHA domain protein TagH [Rheinheimera sp.]
MLLELSVLSYHRLSPRQVAVKRFDSSGGTLGRSEQADWYLPDPERVVSSEHAVISHQNGAFTITDKSTNGLFVNRAVDALGQGNSYTLKHGDLLCMGDYEIQVALIDELQTVADLQSKPATIQPATIQPARVQAVQNDALSQRNAVAPAGNGMLVSDVSGSSFGRSTADTALPEHRAGAELVMDDHFLAPAALIPDDWASAWQTNDNSVAAAVTPAALQTGIKQPAVDKPLKQTSATDGHAHLQAFLKGLGVSEANLQAADSAAWWEQLGQALQQSLQGVITVMHARSEVKNSFRVNQTTFQQRENNPLKFSANIDDAFHNLFNRQGSSFMPPRQAIAEAFADISRHESAIIAGAGGAMIGLLSQLAPQRIEAGDFGGSFVDKLNPAQRQARLWARYKALHAELATELNNKDKQGVNDDFISAYEAFLRKK